MRTIYLVPVFLKWSDVRVGKYQQALGNAEGEKSAGFFPAYLSLEEAREAFPDVAADDIFEVTTDGDAEETK